MAQKKITDLELRDDVDDNVNIPVDDTIQSYRVTAPQIFDYINLKFQSRVRTIAAAGTTLDATDGVVLLDPTAADFSQALPAVASLPNGFILRFKNIATNGKVATLDASGSELIDNALTLALESSPSMDGVTLFNSGTKWLIL